MSGGHWDYIQFQIEDIGKELKGDTHSKEVRDKMKLTGEILIMASKMLHRLDLYFCGDDSESSLHRRWKEDGLMEPEDWEGN